MLFTSLLVLVCSVVSLLIGVGLGRFIAQTDRDIARMTGLFGAPIDAPFHFRGVPSRTLCGRCGLYHPEN